jgi:hypothetical protein
MGRFKKGTSGNPGGRPKLLQDVRDLAREYTREAIETFVHVMKNVKAPATARIAAASALLDRGWGKPYQTVDSNTHVSGNLSHEQWIDKLDAEDAEFRARAAKLFNGAMQP